MLQMKNLNVLNILVNFNFSVEKGEFVLIVGENGAGKSGQSCGICVPAHTESGGLAVHQVTLSGKI